MYQKMQRIDYKNSKNYRDVFSKTYFVSNENPDQTIRFSQILKDKFKTKEGTFLGIIGGIDPFMNFAVNSNCENFIGVDINESAIDLMIARLNLFRNIHGGQEYLLNLFGVNY